MPADAAGVVWIWKRGRSVGGEASGQGHAISPRTLSGVAVLSDSVVEHGHGAGEKLDRDCLAICRAGPRSGVAGKYLRTNSARMAQLDREVIEHHGPGTAVAG